jgi:hypothetical protein
VPGRVTKVRQHVTRLICVSLLLHGAVRVAAAQQRVPAAAGRDSARADTAAKRPLRRLPNSIPDSLLRPPISPKAAFLHSLLLPGLGQSALRRSTAATIFSAAEVGAIYMVAKSRADLRQARALKGLDSVSVGDPSLGETVTRIPVITQELINARRLHLEDWIAILLFNHLLAGADAYVAANLWDLPARVSIQHTPVGPGIGAQIRW